MISLSFVVYKKLSTKNFNVNFFERNDKIILRYTIIEFRDETLLTPY